MGEYPGSWHALYGDMTGESARRIVPPLVELFDIKSTVEVGCGNGHWTQAAIDSGVVDTLALDGPWNDPKTLLIDPARYIAADFSHPLPVDRRFDMAICLEVAEHVQSGSAEILVQSLTKLADVVLFGAAIPLQGGFGHINEQWPSWWRALFDDKNYEAFDLVRPQHWHDRAIHYWYRQNAFVYVNRDNAEKMAIAQRASGNASIPLFDAVHPEKFEETADYRSISFKRLARRLPGWALGRVKAKMSGLK